MARITVEDCLEKIQNHFDLVLLAGKRARDLSKAELPAEPLVEPGDDKPAVVALREIAAGLIDMSYLEERPELEQEEENILAKFQGMEPMEPIDRAFHFDEEEEEADEPLLRPEEPAAREDKPAAREDKRAEGA